MLRYVPALILTGFLIADVSHAAPQELIINLASTNPGSELNLSVPPGEYSVKIINMVPTKFYNIQAIVGFITQPPLPLPTRPGTGLESTVKPPCQELFNSTDKLLKVKKEEEVPAAVDEVNANLPSCPGNTPEEKAVKTAAQSAIDKTMFAIPNTFVLAGGQELVVTISRAEGTDQKRWKVTYQTPARGRWFSSYGFAFVRNNDETYFSKPKEGESGKFTITPKGDNRDYDFAPSLFFSWMPASREGRDVAYGATAGLGFDQSNPIVFVGPIVTYNQNISLVAGAVVHKQKRLHGNYTRGQEITTSLSEDQLKEETFNPGFFFGLSFRFGSNPFAASQDSAKPKPAEVKPAETKPAETKPTPGS